MELIRHEMAHLPAFKELAEEEGITEEICLQFGDTFDAAMTEEAWNRLKTAYETMRRDHGDGNEVIKLCRLIEDASEAEDFSQMKGAMAAIVHPAGSMLVFLSKVVGLSMWNLTNSIHSTDGHISSSTPSCGSCSRKAT